MGWMRKFRRDGSRPGASNTATIVVELISGCCQSRALLEECYGFPPVTAMPKGPAAPLMKLSLTSLPSRFARPIVVPL